MRKEIICCDLCGKETAGGNHIGNVNNSTLFVGIVKDDRDDASPFFADLCDQCETLFRKMCEKLSGGKTISADRPPKREIKYSSETRSDSQKRYIETVQAFFDERPVKRHTCISWKICRSCEVFKSRDQNDNR